MKIGKVASSVFIKNLIIKLNQKVDHHKNQEKLQFYKK